jgi:hypothetical protein
VLDEEAKAYHANRWAQSAISGNTSQSDWNVCPRCMTALSRYLPEFAPKPPVVKDTSPVNVNELQNNRLQSRQRHQPAKQNTGGIF